MSTRLEVGITAYSIQQAKATTAYGQLALIPVRAGSSGAGALFTTALTKIPKNATIVSATIRYRMGASAAGAFTFRAYRLTAKWPTQVVWSKRPAVSLVASTPVNNPANSGIVDLDVTGTVQQMVAGTMPNYGWYLDHSGSTRLVVRGSKATSGRPTLIVTYTVPPPAPTNLEPSDAAVSAAKPVLLFDADASVTAVRVQVDPAANSAATVYEAAATGGMLDLAATAYAGLADGATTYWRAAQQTDGGWSAWSAWVPFTRKARSALTITSPAGSAIADGTPPVTWTFGGTQVAWRARLLDASGRTIADSGRTLGTDTDWTPAKGLTVAGQTGRIEVTVWDNTDRAATVGEPAETIATLDVVLTPDAGIEAYTAVTAAQDGYAPAVTVTGRRSAIPDAVVLLRDGAEVGRWTGADVTTVAPGGGYLTTVTDHTATMNRSAVYALVPVVNGARGGTGSTITYTPRCKGIWLTALDTGESVVLWGKESAEQSQPEMAVVHRPIVDATDVPVVRRRLLRAAPEGAVSGVLADVGPYDATVMEERLRSWVDGDAGDLFTIHLGGYTGTVIVGDVTFTEVDSNPGDGRVLAVALSWWAQ